MPVSSSQRLPPLSVSQLWQARTNAIWHCMFLAQQSAWDPLGHQWVKAGSDQLCLAFYAHFNGWGIQERKGLLLGGVDAGWC